MLSGHVPVSYDIGALVNANVNVLPLVEKVRGALLLKITSMSSEGNFTLIELPLSNESVPRSLSIIFIIDVPSGNRSILSDFSHDDIVIAMTEQAIAPNNNLWFFIMSLC